MPTLIGFTQPNQMLFDKYARHGEGQFAVIEGAEIQISARVYDGYISGGMRRMVELPPDAWWLRLCSIESGELVDVATGPVYTPGMPMGQYADVDGHYRSGTVTNGVFTAVGSACRWTIKRGQYPDGNYEITSNLPGTMGFTLQIRNGVAKVPPSKYLLQRPAFMPGMGGFPTYVKTNIIEFKGIRTTDSAPPVPFIDAGVFTKPFAHSNSYSDLWSESFGTNVPDYDGCAWPSTAPGGGLHYVAKQRYTVFDFASVVPDVDGYRVIPKNEAIYDHSPSERSDGGPGTGGAGVVPSGFRNSDGSIYILATTGSIIKVDFATREMKTVYGWVKKPGTPQPTAHALLPVGAERVTWLNQFFDFVGTGPTISRAWQMCRDINDEMVVYVADATNHTIIKVDLRSSIGTVIAGTSGVAGWADGALGTAQFNQPRGICMISTGPWAGKLIVADEHNSAFRQVDPVTGVTNTLSRAKRVPTRFPGDFSATDLTRKFNRLAFGAPTNADGTFNTAFKVQSFGDAQFCHPCHLAVLSDGKTVISVNHDEYRGFRLDLEARTLTHLFDMEGAATRADVSPKDWPTIHADTNGSMGWGVDTLWVCGWHYNNMDIYSPAGTRVYGNWVGWGTCGDHRGLRHNAYNRSMIVLGDGSFIFNGDGQNSLQRVRKAIPSDPVIDRVRHSRGNDLYRADGPGRASVMTMNGAVGMNYLAQLKTPNELAMMSKAARKTYMLDKFKVTDWTDQDHDDVAYYLDWNCAQGAERLRNPPISFDEAVAMAKLGAPMKRKGSMTVLTTADASANDWLAPLKPMGVDEAVAQAKMGVVMKRDGAAVTLNNADVIADDWLPPPAPVGIDEAVAQAKLGTDMQRVDSTAALTNADVIAMDWLAPPAPVDIGAAAAQAKSGVTMQRGGSAAVLTGADVLATDWVKV